jgi:glycine/D-amino acid oxidase-like deaminating enzyme
MISYWEQQSFISYEHIIIGAGIVGLSTAIELRSHFPSARILVLERGLLPSGASSRNAGFACMGSVTELLDDLELMTEAEIVALYDWRKKGLERLRHRLGDTVIGYQENGSYELIGDHEMDALDKIDYLNQLLAPVTQKPAFALANGKIAEFGFSSSYTKAIIQNTCEGELHTGKMLSALTSHALALGIEIKTGAEVVSFEETPNNVHVQVKDPFHNSLLLLNCQSLSHCTNAFAKDLLPQEDITPGRGQVLITQPIEGLKFKGIFHFDKGYYYFRELDGRILIGGGRNLDFDEEATTAFELNGKIQIELERKLHEVIVPGSHILVEQRWAGIMAFGPNKYPIVKSFSDRVFGAFRMGGMGVALGSEVAAQVADMIRIRF